MTGGRLMGIEEVARRTGLTVRAVRHYEAAGLLPPDVDGPGPRGYRDADVERLRLAARMRPLGLCLADVRALLDLLDRLPGFPRQGGDGPDGECADVAARLRRHADHADLRCADLRAELERAEGFARALREHADRVERASAARSTAAG
ncbi:hypothetical protein BIV57_20010 [Mangrovactinospora gilvigrisea]|uniref:HTH merR-type domain-containing protein n=1 Tax=Mangrovactinospora gilvigrisea TaxID=1428644 RepID=A0A1J7C2G9_9ACTN|nr:MerR family transcriptional regulator [Mangrovactinospora gilvigrisea]OIV35760.1 hypothetical protein BIV57_20010 [Mangrovactinospora gilvigrisea]